MPRGPRIGEILIQAGIIDSLQLEAALGQQQRWGGRLGRSLVGLGFIDEPTLLRVLSHMLRVPVAQLGHKRPSPDALELINAELAEKYCCIPLFTKREGGKAVLFLGMEDPSDLAALDELAFRLGMPVRPVLVAPTELHEAIARLYHHRGGGGDDDPGETFRETLLEPGDTAPVIVPIFGESDAHEPDLDPLVPTVELTDVEPAAEPPSARRETPPLAPPTLGAPEPIPADAPQAAPDKPRDVPTRTILRALTRVLIEKGVLTREELLQCVRAVDAAATRRSDPQA